MGLLRKGSGDPAFGPLRGEELVWTSGSPLEGYEICTLCIRCVSGKLLFGLVPSSEHRPDVTQKHPKQAICETEKTQASHAFLCLHKTRLQHQTCKWARFRSHIGVGAGGIPGEGGDRMEEQGSTRILPLGCG